MKLNFAIILLHKVLYYYDLSAISKNLKIYISEVMLNFEILQNSRKIFLEVNGLFQLNIYIDNLTTAFFSTIIFFIG